MYLTTTFTFPDLLRNASGSAKVVLQSIADAGKQYDFMNFAQDIFQDTTPKIEQFFQWTALARFGIYEQLGMTEDADNAVEEEIEEDIITLDADDIYR